QRRVVDTGSGYLCQMEPVAHFGLGTVDEVDEVEIRWPDGETLRLHDLAIDQLHRIEYPH
ncbi:MAG: ASPIC/UnbV domain-containing protein, partial [Anaerolineae bacterium]|nr:ASPIC/UnbV domain-containing protein [Anaerolineae bacterium]